MTNLDSILKIRDLNLPTMVCLVKAMVFPVVIWIWELDSKESCAPKNWCFWTWCWRLLGVPWTARRSNQSILKEISPGRSLEGLMLKLKLQYFGHPMWRVDSLEKTLMLRTIEGKRRGWERMRWHHRLNGHEFEQTAWKSEGQGRLVCCSSSGCKESDITYWLNNKNSCYHCGKLGKV